jgi:hypothetical protein
MKALSTAEFKVRGVEIGGIKIEYYDAKNRVSSQRSKERQKG